MRNEGEINLTERFVFTGSASFLNLALTAAVIFAVLVFVPSSINPSIEASGSQARPEDSFLLQSGRAGAFELGMTVDEVYRLAGRDRTRLVDKFREGLFSPALEIRLPGHNQGPAIIADIREWPCAAFSIWGISVLDRRFRTQDGLGIGSTLGELRRYYKVTVGSGKGGQSAHAPALNLTFALEAVRKPTDSSKVTSVWVLPQPVEVRKRRCPGLGPLGAE